MENKLVNAFNPECFGPSGQKDEGTIAHPLLKVYEDGTVEVSCPNTIIDNDKGNRIYCAMKDIPIAEYRPCYYSHRKI